MNSLKFSVVIPCYNASSTIARTLESLKDQTFKHFEIIVVDDASGDQDVLLEIIRPYGEYMDITILTNDINRNGAYSRNRGIEVARAEYIAFLDADDEWVSTRLESVLSLIEKTEDNQFIIYGRFELIRNHYTGALLPIRSIKTGELVSDYVFAAGQHMQTSTFVCPADVARMILFDVNLIRHQDSDFMMRAQEKGVRFIFQDIKCASYYFRSDDMRKRISSGRINSDFCLRWLEIKRHYFSEASIAGYMLSIFSRVIYFEGHKVQSFQMSIHALAKIGWRNIFDLAQTKFFILYKSRLGL